MRNESRSSAGLLVLLGCVACAHAGRASLPRSTPEAEGISSQAIVDFVEGADQNVDTFDSFRILCHGKVIAEGWWKPNSAGQPHIMNSVSKSFTSTAVGLAIENQKLSLDDLVLKFFPADARKSFHVQRPSCRTQSGWGRPFGETVSRSAFPLRSRKLFPLQHDGHLRALGNRDESDRPNCIGIPQTTAFRSPRD